MWAFLPFSALTFYLRSKVVDVYPVSFGFLPKDAVLSLASFAILPKDVALSLVSFGFLPKDVVLFLVSLGILPKDVGRVKGGD